MSVKSSLVDARVRWTLMLKQLGQRGLPDDQLWPFPKNTSETSKRLIEVQEYLLKNPDTYNQGGLWERYRNHLEEILSYYEEIREYRSEKRKTRWILAAGIIAAISGTIAAFGGFGEIVKWVKIILRLPS